MMPRFRVLTLVLMLALIGAGSPLSLHAANPARHAAQAVPTSLWEITELATLNGASSAAHGLNNAGQIVG